MIDALVVARAIDPSRIFVTGLSAGGAMTSIMLAAYPELFAGGAVIAGLPFSGATTFFGAFAHMRGRGYPSTDRLAAMIREASDHEGPWPRISIWQGSADYTVDPSNADRIVGQWRAVHGVGAVPSEDDAVDGYPRQVWRDDNGRVVVESYEITGMGHGTPLQTGGSNGCGASGAYMLEAGISSTRLIARFWGLTEDEGLASGAATSASAIVRATPFDTPAMEPASLPRLRASTIGGTIIEDALRAIGLMR